MIKKIYILFCWSISQFDTQEIAKSSVQETDPIQWYKKFAQYHSQHALLQKSLDGNISAVIDTIDLGKEDMVYQHAIPCSLLINGVKNSQVKSVQVAERSQ